MQYTSLYCLSVLIHKHLKFKIFTLRQHPLNGIGDFGRIEHSLKLLNHTTSFCMSIHLLHEE